MKKMPHRGRAMVSFSLCCCTLQSVRKMCMMLGSGLIVYLATNTSRAAVPSVELAGASCPTSCDGLFLEP